jgi:Tfp pilus assembly protein PilZ
LKTKRRYERIIRRLEIEFSAKDQTHRGISSNFSLGGIFIRTNRAFEPGTEVDLLIHLPDGTRSKAKGIVKMAMKTPVVSLKNGMGVEITEKDQQYIKFVETLLEGAGSKGEGDQHEPVSGSKGEGDQHEPVSGEAEAPESEPAPGISEFFIVSCPLCGVKNRVKVSNVRRGAKCGKCGAALTIT